jgi:bacteriorhodopsin
MLLTNKRKPSTLLVKGEFMIEITQGQYNLVFNMLSFAVATMFAAFVFFMGSRQDVGAKYRPALLVSALVVFIAGYHYWRILGSWEAAFQLVDGKYQPSGKPFNDAYRYVDWLLTVPLLLVELVAVLSLAKDKASSMLTRLVIAALAMIALGYPGEISSDIPTRHFWGFLSTVPFVYILYVLWGELGKQINNESAHVKKLLSDTRYLLLATWGFYPIVYALPQFGVDASSSIVGIQVGYSIADVLAKAFYGVMIYRIARAKSEADGSLPK